MRILQRLYFLMFNRTGCIRSVLTYKMPILLSNPKLKYGLNQLACPSLLSASYLTDTFLENSEDEEKKNVNVTSPTSFLEKSCTDSLKGISELLLQFSQAVTESAFQYKNSLNELISFLEKHENVKDYPTLSEENESAIVAAKAKVFDCKKEFLKLITLVQSVEKLATAVAGLSYLVAAETIAVSVSETVSSIRETIDAEVLEVKSVENRYLKLEQAMIQDEIGKELTRQ